ncbi:MAG: GNAT family N-acetyltransferase [Gemmatimonadetes bacterium]|nr:GNAT family N-acetyltransferase [Gemmatimonadota bacterium]
MPPIDVTRTYLELTDPARLRPARLPDPSLALEQVSDCPPALYRHLYGTVGAQYHWVDRQGWTDGEIRAYIARPEISIWILRRGTAEVGYFELAQEPDGSTEIAYFGLFPGSIGQGFGKHLLTVAVEQAWATGARRVWLHTCTLDHAAALPNYLKRGFTPFRTEVYQATVPA